ncbi:MAG: PAS domain S-box protein, partial [Planctomycetes bacterium]|nr:PAS domain S-box protein [Planctomycetota bacterium]
ALRIEIFFQDRFSTATMIAERLAECDKDDVIPTYHQEADVFLRNSQGIQAFNFVNPEGVIVEFSPDNESNIEAKNKNLLDHQVAGPVLTLARVERKTQVTKPLKLYQGGEGVVSYFPIYDKEGYFHGWLNVVFRIEDALAECFTVSPPTDFALQVTDEQGQLELFSLPLLTETEEIGVPDTPLKVGGHTWLLKMQPSAKLYAKIHDIGDEVLLIGGLILMLVVSWLVHRTERDHRAARIAQRDLQDILNKLPVDVFVKDLEGVYIFANASPDGQARPYVGKTDFELIPRERAEAVRSKDRRALQSGDLVREEYSVDRKGVISTYRTLRFPLRRPDESIRALCVVGVDVSEERKLLDQVQRSETRYRKLYNETPVMMHSIDAEGRIVSVSDFWLRSMGYAREEVLGRRSLDFLTAESRERAVREAFPKFYADGRIDGYSFTWVRKDGTTFEGLLSAVMNRDSDVEDARSIGVIIDMTERNRAEARLKRLNRELERRVAQRTAQLEGAMEELRSFTYSVSHDLRAPLRAIRGFVQIVLDEHRQVLTKVGNENLERVLRAADRMNEQFEGLLKLSRVSSADLTISPIDLSALTEEVFYELRNTKYAGSRAALFVEPRVFTRGDKSLIRLLLTNLIDNALKFSAKADAPQIEFRARFIEGEAQYVVSDNGVGVDPSKREQITKPFVRGHEDSDFEGTGIGLAIAQRVVARHGGTLNVTPNEAQGISVVFTLDPDLSAQPEAP